MTETAILVAGMLVFSAIMFVGHEIYKAIIYVGDALNEQTRRMKP